MLYQFFIISEGDILVEWNREGFPGEANLVESEIINRERIKKIYSALTAEERESFNSITVGRLAVSILLRRDVAYAIVSDKADAVKARKNVLRDLANDIAPNLKKLKEGKTVPNLQGRIQRKVKSHIRAMAGVRSRSSTSFILGLIGGVLFFLGVSWIGELSRGMFAPSDIKNPFFVWLIGKTFISKSIQNIYPVLSIEWISLVLFYLLLAILTGLIVGWISGRSVGGFVASLIIVMVTFSIPILFEVVTIPESLREFLLEYYPILPYIQRYEGLFGSVTLTELSRIRQTLSFFGVGFGFLSALIAAAIGYVVNSGSLLGSQIAFKPKEKPRKPKKKAKERESEEVEELEEVEIEEDELEELEELFGE
ncbi:MAG: hypothetical protein GWO20_00150 [Candidatus Korarchaeota archaeon]|nr:hypothetical protein [Candidatus Korarchaeota archaeon]NIU81959.1 hypothetical protein [Candidatus Thorarchaeota archaeon]NIW12409.1 hypothetical protein [Candidatus Thorarchaeota archaeon]NIW50630.1 hypothetical protein [Candidatus Korarchaeota archaeon]